MKKCHPCFEVLLGIEQEWATESDNPNRKKLLLVPAKRGT